MGAIVEHRTIVIDDLEQEQRWPRYRERASLELGVRSMLSLQLFVTGETLGALARAVGLTEVVQQLVEAGDGHH